LSARSVERATSGTEDNFIATGMLENIREYADIAFRDDEDQKQAFEVIIAAFCVQLHKEAHKNDHQDSEFTTAKRRRYNKIRETLENVNKGPQLIAFLS
jgi:GMP synthase-like glutamine amidotransferase